MLSTSSQKIALAGILTALLAAPLPASAKTTKHPTKAAHHKVREEKAKKHRKSTHKRRHAARAKAAGGKSVVNDPLQAISGAAAGLPTDSTPSGQSMPSGSLSGWKQVFSDNFTTDVPLGGFSGCSWNTGLANSNCTGLPSSVASKWWAYPDGWSDTSGNGQYAPSKVLSIHNGEMDFDLHSAGGTPLVAAPEPKIPGTTNAGGMKYGAYVVRFKASEAAGYKTAWLLWPTAYDGGSVSWPSQGEVDFPEGNLNGNINGFLHWEGSGGSDQVSQSSTSDGYTSWHTAVIEWEPGQLRFILDGKLISSTNQHVPDNPMRWVLQTETSTDGMAPSATTTAHVLVDWVSVYSPTA